jgi:hypothetical protein
MGRLAQGIMEAGETEGIEFCLDAGEFGGGQIWRDQTVAGNDFMLGRTTAIGTDDPTFNGTSGGSSVSEYFQVDGGDGFALAPGVNPPWIDAMHCAKATFSLLFLAYVPTAAAIVFFSTENGSGSRGWELDCVSGTTVRVNVTKESGFALTNNVGSGIVNDALCAVHISFAEGVVNGFVYSLNGAVVQSSTLSYTTPSTGKASFPAVLGARGDFFADFSDSGVRFYGVAGWSRAMTAARHAAVYKRIKAPFGLP